MIWPADDAALAEALAARTLEIVDVPSQSREESALCEHVLGVLQAGGVNVRAAGDDCLIATAGTAGAPLLVFAGHLDTVPAQDNIPGRRDEQFVHGLGASDMKAGLAMMVELALALAGSAPIDMALAFVFFPREELPPADSGLAPLLEREPALREARLALVMEPTLNTIQAGCLGNVNATWTFHGRSGHSARPWLADNAIERAAAGIARLSRDAPATAYSFDGLDFTEAATVTRIAAGVADNVIPGEAACHVNYRYPPGMSAQEAEARLRGWCERDGETLEITSNAPSAPVAVSEPLVQRLIAAGSLDVGPKQAWTPVAEFAAAGVPAVNFGPGDPAYAHRADERVEIAELVRCARVLERFLAP